MTEKPALKLAEMAPQPSGVVATTAQQPRGLKLRHRVIMASFVAMVLIPTAVGIGYLYTRAADQFHSIASFSVRSEDFQNPLDALSAFTQVGSSSASDSTILYDFIRSQPMVELIDARLDLSRIYNRAPEDVVFSLGEGATREDMVSYWDRMVHVAIDGNSGVIDIDVRAFAPEDASAIAEAVLVASSDLVNDLSRIAREDAMRYALEDVATAEERLKELRRQIRVFRSENQIIDPEADVASQMGVVGALQSQLAGALIELQTLGEYAREGDARLVNLERRIEAIRNQIALERESVSGATSGGRPLSTVIGEYEELLVDLEFSQNAYTAALAAGEQARAEARRKSRYIAVHIPPTTAEEALYPQRGILSLLLLACTFAAWSVCVMIYYNVRDRS